MYQQVVQDEFMSHDKSQHSQSHSWAIAMAFAADSPSSSVDTEGKHLLDSIFSFDQRLDSKLHQGLPVKKMFIYRVCMLYLNAGWHECTVTFLIRLLTMTMTVTMTMTITTSTNMNCFFVLIKMATVFQGPLPWPLSMMGSLRTWSGLTWFRMGWSAVSSP